jgi:hypothetical protein
MRRNGVALIHKTMNKASRPDEISFVPDGREKA